MEIMIFIGIWLGELLKEELHTLHTLKQTQTMYFKFNIRR